MIRVLASILAIVAILLAVVLRQPLLFVAAGVLAGVVVLAFVLVQRRRHAAEREVVSVVHDRDELRALGILEIRPKGKDGAPETGPAPTRTPVSDGAPSDGAPEPVMAPSGEAQVDEADLLLTEEEAMHERDQSLRVRQKDPATFVAVASGGRLEDVLVPCLHAMRAALGAHTVCLLRQEEIALRYRIDAIVSQNGFARSHGRFATKVPLLTTGMAKRPVTLRHVDEEDLPAKNLGYYREPIAIRQVALAPVACGDEATQCILLADAREEGGLDGPRPQALIAQFARLIGTLLDTRPPGTPAAPVRPRREIIAEEMARARADQHPLALALVYFNGAEPRTEGDQDAVAAAEATLHTCLCETAPDTRVERFGELTYGIFYCEPHPTVEAWALQLQENLAAHPRLEGGVSVGVALLQDRHQSPDDFKAEVTAALYEAYESGKCIIIE